MAGIVIVFGVAACLAFGWEAWKRRPSAFLALGGLAFTLAWMIHEGALS